MNHFVCLNNLFKREGGIFEKNILNYKNLNMNLYRDDNQYYSQIVNEGTARHFRNGQSSTSSNRLHVNNQNTAKPDYIINQMSVDGRRMIEWGFPNYPGNNGKYDASHCLPKSSGGSNSNSKCFNKFNLSFLRSSLIICLRKHAASES